MARPVSITNAQIIAAAREVFLEKGIRATTSEVARRAGIAEGSIFKRFATKKELFAAAMQLQPNAPLPWAHTLTERDARKSIRTTLTEIGTEMIAFFRRILPLVMMSWSNTSGSSELPDHLRGPNAGPLRASRALTAFFAEEIERGRLAPRDPEILARTFLGTLQHYAFFEILLSSHGEKQIPEKKFLEGLVDLLTEGAPRRPRRKTRATRRK